MAQRLVQHAAVGNAGQTVGGGQLRQFLLGHVAQAQLPAQQPGQPQQANAQHARGAADHQRGASPGGEHIVAGERNDDCQGQVADPGKGVQALPVVDARHAIEAAVALAQDALDIGAVGEASADRIILEMGLLRQQDAVVADDRQDAAFADVQTFEQLIEIAQAHRRDGDAEKFPRSRGNAPAEMDPPAVVVVARPADEHFAVSAASMRQEVIAVGKVARFGIDS